MKFNCQPRFICATVMLFTLSTPFCFASEVAPPPLTKEGLIGIWEAPDEGGFRWYRMEIFAGGGYLALAETIESTVYKLEYFKITGINTAKLRFRNTNPNSSFGDVMIVDAIGYGLDKDHGELHATLTSHLANVHDKRYAYFHKGTVASRDAIRRMKEAAKSMRDAKRKRL